MGCGVSGNMPGNPQGFSAQTWTCQASVQLAQGTTISSPGQAKADLAAKKESTAVQVASLRNQLGQSEERGFGFAGKDGGDSAGAAHPVSDELARLTAESEQLDRQIRSIESINLPDDVVVLKDGTWTVEGDRVTFHSETPYTPGQKVVVPYVMKTAQGEIVKVGYLPVDSIRVEQPR
ncbi:hypothetical protein W02_17360 [Nitrospira sp. KM1]|nr:hypothetical protein W02_17360 [Nitrospira sp. KM1]